MSLRVHRDAKPTRKLLSWAIETTFRVEDVVSWLASHAAVATLVRASKRPLLVALAAGIASGDSDGTASEAAVAEAGLALGQEIAERQRADVNYWRPIIDELRRLRARGELLEVGSPVV